MAQHGIVHGDLSAYNLLAAGERLVIIDLPQVLDLVGNPQGMDFLLRDCANVCAWFRSKGLARGRRRARLFSDVLTAAVLRPSASDPDGALELPEWLESRSMIVTLAWPPPSHMVCRP